MIPELWEWINNTVERQDYIYLCCQSVASLPYRNTGLHFALSPLFLRKLRDVRTQSVEQQIKQIAPEIAFCSQWRLTVLHYSRIIPSWAEITVFQERAEVHRPFPSYQHTIEGNGRSVACKGEIVPWWQISYRKQLKTATHILSGCNGMSCQIDR